EDKGKRCDLLLALGDALDEGGQPRRVLDRELPEAFSLAEALGDKRRAARACFLATLALAIEGANLPQVWMSPEAAEWAGRADRYAETGTVERVRADLTLGLVRYYSGERHQGIALFSRALDLARELGDSEIFWFASYLWLFIAAVPRRAEELLHLAEKLVASSRAGVRPVTLGAGLWNAGCVFFDWGQRQPAEKAWHELQELTERSGHVYVMLVSAMLDGLLATISGRLEDGEQ
ncbi:unnamed protein product, partial [marine sediment metagenome]